jgi:predicted P-loop ATPase
MNKIDYSRFALFDSLAGVSDLLTSQTTGNLSFRFCSFSGEVQTDKGESLEDLDILRAAYELETQYRWAKQPPSKTRVHDSIILAASRNTFHPVREYLKSLKWDGVDRCKNLFSAYLGGTDSELRRAQGIKFLVSAVARVMEPGSKVDTMPVLVGSQGSGKSTAIKILAKNPKWFRDTPLDLKNKDCYDALQGVWFVEIAEMKSILAENPETVKAFLTSEEDTYRPAYGRCKVRRPRQCVFFGSSNGLNLSDTTGNRRYWPIVIENELDLTLLAQDVDELWAEAFVLWSGSYRWWLETDELVEVAREEVAAFVQIDPWEQKVLNYALGKNFLISDLLEALGVPIERQKKHDVMRTAKILRAAGYHSFREYRGDSRLTFWTRKN